MADATDHAAPAPGMAPAATAPGLSGAASPPTVEQLAAERDYWRAEASKAFAARDAVKAEARAKAGADAPVAAIDKGTPTIDTVLATIAAQQKAAERGLRRAAIEREIADSILPEHASELHRFDDVLVDAVKVEDGIVRGAKEAVAAFRARYPGMFRPTVASPGSSTASGAPSPQIDYANLQPGDISQMPADKWAEFQKARKAAANGGGRGFL